MFQYIFKNKFFVIVNNTNASTIVRNSTNIVGSIITSIHNNIIVHELEWNDYITI